MSSFVAGEDLFELAGVAKNLLDDCWEFVCSSASPRKQKQALLGDDCHADIDTPSLEAKPETDCAEGEHSDEEHEGEKHDDGSGSAKKKKHRRKKRSKSVSSSTTGGSSSSSSAGMGLAQKDLHVQWGSVEQLVFSRSFGLDAVPSDGLYPLGLGDFEERCCFTVDELFAQKQLREHLVRQAAEEERRKAQPVRQSARIRKGSFDLSDAAKEEKEREKEKEKSNKALFSPQAKSEYERIKLLREFVEVPPRADHVEIHADLVRVRDSRNFVGCSCKPLKVDKLNVGKLKAELLARKHLLKEEVDVEKLKKHDLVHFLKDVLKECPTCISESCECVQQGISCASNACDCVHRPGESESCMNPLGNRSYDVERVRQYRGMSFRCDALSEFLDFLRVLLDLRLDIGDIVFD